MDNCTPLVYVNRLGSEAEFDFVGGSRVVESSGHVVADLGTMERTAVIDVALLSEVPADVDYRRHLHPDLY